MNERSVCGGDDARGCPWGPCNAASFRICSRSGRDSFDPTDRDNCGAPECAPIKERGEKS